MTRFTHSRISPPAGTNMAVYQSLLTKDSVNPNGCTAKATFFVSHKYSNYSAVQARGGTNFLI